MQPTHQPRIYVAGHRGMVGAAIVRALQAEGYTNLVTRTHAELDLTDQAAVRAFFQSERIDQVYLAAAKVGGIHANNTYPAEFIYENLAIQTNVIHEAWRAGVNKLLFLGSSCIYPRDCPQPIKEEYMLTGPLEPTNEPYAIAKIAGIKMCESYNRQFGTDYRSVMPCNLYGPGDNYHPEDSHVIPALIRKFHEAKQAGAPTVTVWGSGKPRREFLFSDDMANACTFLMNLPSATYDTLQGDGQSASGRVGSRLVNIGVGKDITIGELAEMVRSIVGFSGDIVFDASKPDGTRQKLMDIQKSTLLGWRVSMDLREGLKIAYEAFTAPGKVAS